jgi:hypothetical protein
VLVVIFFFFSFPFPPTLCVRKYNENFKSLAKKQTHHRVKIRLMAMHHIQQGHTYASILIFVNCPAGTISRTKTAGLSTKLPVDTLASSTNI